MNLALRTVEELLDANQLVDMHLEVQDRIREAAMVLWRQPKTAEERYLNAGNRCSWPQYVRDWHAYGADRARMPKIPPQPREIDRCDEVLGWIAWLATQDEAEAKLLWRRFGQRERTKVLAHRLGVHRQTINRKCRSGIQRIVDQYLSGRAVR